MNKQKKPQFYDKGMKEFFSHPGVIKQLMETFVKFDFVKDIDFSTIEFLRTTFIRKDYQKRESDLIVSLKYHNEEIFLYLLIEFQSSVDKWMPLRMLSYVIDFYEYLIKKERKRSNLPVILPVMIYNGEKKWSAETTIRKLIGCDHSELEKFLPGFEYMPFIINQIDNKILIATGNTLSAMFLTEKISGDENYEKMIEIIIKIISSEKNTEIREAFINWFMRSVDYRNFKPVHTGKFVCEEEITMLRTFVKNIEKQGVKQGVKQGEYQKALQTAKNLVNLNVSLEIITKSTGLSEEVIKKIAGK